MRNPLKSLIVGQTKSNHIIGSSRIHQVHETIVLRDRNWFAAAARSNIDQPQEIAEYAKHGKFTAASIHREQQGAVVTQRKRSLRSQRIGSPTTSSSAGE